MVSQTPPLDSSILIVASGSLYFVRSSSWLSILMLSRESIKRRNCRISADSLFYAKTVIPSACIFSSSSTSLFYDPLLLLANSSLCFEAFLLSKLFLALGIQLDGQSSSIPSAHTFFFVGHAVLTFLSWPTISSDSVFA